MTPAADRLRAMANRRPGQLTSNAYDIGQSIPEQALLDLLEGLVDRPPVMILPGLKNGGFSYIVDCLGDVALQKAEHLRETWQDEAAAARYDALADKLWQVAAKIDLV